MTGPLDNSEFVSLKSQCFPSTSSRETLRFEGNEIDNSPRDQSLSVKCCTLLILYGPSSEYRAVAFFVSGVVRCQNQYL